MGVSMEQVKQYTREELYALVWSKPMIELAKDFGLSDKGLAKNVKTQNSRSSCGLLGQAKKWQTSHQNKTSKKY